MKRYINTKTGAIIDSINVISGEHWILEETEVTYHNQTDEVITDNEEELKETEEVEEENTLDEEEIILDSLTLEELKMLADDEGIKYAANIGRETLIAKFEKQGE